MILFTTKALQTLLTHTLSAAPSPTRRPTHPLDAEASSPVFQERRRAGERRPWKVEASGDSLVLRIPEALEITPEHLATLVEEVKKVRASGLRVALACRAGRSFEDLLAVHFHRFVDIFPNHRAAFRWLQSTAPAESFQAA